MYVDVRVHIEVDMPGSEAWDTMPVPRFLLQLL